MGYTAFSKQLVEKYISEYNPKSVIDLGAQNDFSGPNLPAPYISEWYIEKKIKYACIDLNGENGAAKQDLSMVFKSPRGWQDDFVLDMGTSEHIGRDGEFDWEAIYNCWCNKFFLCREGGIIISENPMSENWPKHGYNYYVSDFYIQLSKIADLNLLEVGRHAATGNVTDGWNVFAVMEKTGSSFCSLEQFKTLPLKQS